MSMKIIPGARKGALSVPVSKSQAHRALICAALSFGCRPVEIYIGEASQDIDATIQCIKALKAAVTALPDGFLRVEPIPGPQGMNKRPGRCRLNAGESGSTLRFLLPVCGALGASAGIAMAGRLPERPMEPLVSELVRHGMRIGRSGDQLLCDGKLEGGTFDLPGNVSSQFISGLMFALPLLPAESFIRIHGTMESKPYADLTRMTLSACGIAIEETEDGYFVPAGQAYLSPQRVLPEGDWSGAAAFACMGALPGGEVSVCELALPSGQADSAIVDILKRIGARADMENGALHVKSAGVMKPVVLDASQFPDLVPVLAALCCGAAGESRISGLGRLRMKESDRLAGTRDVLRALGADIEVEQDSLRIRGRGRLNGGEARVLSDHRLAMAASVAACIADHPVTVDAPECVGKSFPSYWEAFNALEVVS